MPDFTVWQWVGAAMIAIAAVLPAGSKLRTVLDWLRSKLPVFGGSSAVSAGTDIDDLGHAMIAWFDAHDGDVRPEVNAIMRKAVDLEFPAKEQSAT